MQTELLSPDIETLVKEERYADVARFLSTRHPTEDAELIEGLEPEEIYHLFKKLDPRTAIDIFRELPDTLQSETAELLSNVELTQLLKILPPDEPAGDRKSVV